MVNSPTPTWVTGTPRPTAKGMPDSLQTGSFDLEFLEAYRIASRIVQEDRRDTRHGSLTMQVWELRASTSSYLSASVESALAKYCGTGHAVTKPQWLLIRSSSTHPSVGAREAQEGDRRLESHRASRDRSDCQHEGLPCFFQVSSPQTSGTSTTGNSSRCGALWGTKRRRWMRYTARIRFCCRFLGSQGPREAKMGAKRWSRAPMEAGYLADPLVDYKYTV